MFGVVSALDSCLFYLTLTNVKLKIDTSAILSVAVSGGALSRSREKDQTTLPIHSQVQEEAEELRMEGLAAAWYPMDSASAVCSGRRITSTIPLGRWRVSESNDAAAAFQ